MNSLNGVHPLGKLDSQFKTIQDTNLKTNKSFPDHLKSYNGWQPDYELWPPNPSQGQFYMVFKPDFPRDLRDKLKAMQADPKTDQKQFMDMYVQTFFPEDFGPAWDSSWEGRLTTTIRANRGLVSTLEPAYRPNAEKVNNLLTSLLNKEPSILPNMNSTTPYPWFIG